MNIKYSNILDNKQKNKRSNRQHEVIDKDFYKGLEQKFISYKSKQGSVKQSRARQSSKNGRGAIVRRTDGRQQRQKGKNKQKNKEKQRYVKQYLYVRGNNNMRQDQFMQEITQHYKFDSITFTLNKLVEQIKTDMQSQITKFISINITQLAAQLDKSTQTKTECVGPFIQAMVRIFQKCTICIYSIAEPSTITQSISSTLSFNPNSRCMTQPSSKENRSVNGNSNVDSFGAGNKLDLYDMLSIRRELKTDPKLLVQTNIINNSKTVVILRRLIDVAKEREKLMLREMGVKTIVFRIRGIVSVDQSQQQQHQKQNQYRISTTKQIQLQICSGGCGEIGTRDLMGAQKFRQFINIHVTPQQFTIQDLLSQQTKQHLPKNLQKPQKRECQSQLITKIKTLQQQLTQKRRQLESEKQRRAEEQAIQAELEDIVLPSERPMVNIEKYESRGRVGTVKGKLG